MRSRRVAICRETATRPVRSVSVRSRRGAGFESSRGSRARLETRRPAPSRTEERPAVQRGWSPPPPSQFNETRLSRPGMACLAIGVKSRRVSCRAARGEEKDSQRADLRARDITRRDERWRLKRGEGGGQGEEEKREKNDVGEKKLCSRARAARSREAPLHIFPYFFGRYLT